MHLILGFIFNLPVDQLFLGFLKTEKKKKTWTNKIRSKKNNTFPKILHRI